MGIFHRKAAKAAEERKETKIGGMNPDNHVRKATWPRYTLMAYDLCDPLRPWRLCGKSNLFG
jgi:hypothetical protein